MGSPLAAIRSLKSLSLDDARSKTGENVAPTRLSSTRSSPGVCTPGLAWGDYGSSRPAIEGACARAWFCSQSRERQLNTSKGQRRIVVSKEVSKEARKEKPLQPLHGPWSTEAEAEAPTPSSSIVTFPIPRPPPKPAGHGSRGRGRGRGGGGGGGGGAGGDGPSPILLSVIHGEEDGGGGVSLLAEMGVVVVEGTKWCQMQRESGEEILSPSHKHTRV